MESASTGLDGARQELDRLDRQGLDNGLDSGSTEPRQLDSSTARAQPGGYRPGPRAPMTYPDLIVLRTKRLRKIRAYTAYIVRVRPVSTLELHSSRICARHFMRVVSYNPGAYPEVWV
jgi:hypothetical protein